MFALLRAAFAALKTALYWIGWACWQTATFPFRMLGGSSGRSSVPAAPSIDDVVARAPTRNGPDGNALVRTQQPNPLMLEQRQAMSIIAWLSKKQRMGSGAGELSPQFSTAIKHWAYRLDDDEIKTAIRAGFVRLSAHLAGRKLVAGLPVHGSITRPDPDDGPNRRRSPSNKGANGLSRRDLDQSTDNPASLTI